MSTPPPPAPPLALHRMAIFTPGRQSDDEIRASFIARQDVLDRILEDIRATRAGSIPQHHLLIGQRGMGKTTLLRRLHVALREQPLAQSFIPLGFPEEQYSVDRLSTVFLNCLDALADTLEQENGSEALITKIDEAVERLRKDRAAEEIVAQDAERTLIEIAAEIGRRPVLLVDNLGLIFERLKKPELHQFRAFLMKNSAPIVIGASAQMLDQDYAAPFYDHFKTHPLGRLSYEDMRDVILRLAERTGNTDIPARIDQESGRLHALHALTGGNPRTTRILFDVFSHGFSQEAYQDLEMLLDWMTPLYKSRFEELSPQAQIVVSSIATMWEPVVLSRICEATRLLPNQISPQLDRLKKADVIEEVTVDPPDRTGPIPEQRTPRDRTGYQITERFFNIWFLMRQATRRDKRNLIYLTRFIECLHSSPKKRNSQKAAIQEKVILAAHDENWGQASVLICGLIERLGDRAMFPKEQQDDWITLSAALLHYGYGEKLLELLADTGAEQKLRPWAEAIRAHLRGDAKYLRNAPVEVRDAAKVLFGEIQSKLAQLPESTRRWVSPGEVKKTSKKAKM